MFITLWLLSYWQSFFDTNLQRMTSSLICNEHGSGSNSFMYLTTDMITYLFYNVGSSEHCYSLFLLLRALGIRIASRDAAGLWCSELLQHLSNITLPCFSWLFCFCLRLALSLSFPFLTFCGFFRSTPSAFDPGQYSGLVHWIPLRSIPDPVCCYM